MYDELIAELRKHHCDAKEDDTQEVCEECAYDVIIADKSVPSGIASVCVCGLMNRAADAIEELTDRNVGKWQITDAYPHNVYCSECHKKFAQTHWAVWEDGSLPRNYCPNCGAQMEES